MVRKIEDTCQLEICCFDLQSIHLAEEAGIQQVELCVDYGRGGLWPGEDLLMAARTAFSGQLSVMIRPRPGDFIYSDEEIGVMLNQVRQAETLGADGCTFGALTSGKEVDRAVVNQIMSQASSSLIWTFHRGIDLTPDIEQNLIWLAELGIHRVLTSGGQGRAIDHIDRLGELTRQQQGQLDIVAAGSIRSEHLDLLRNAGIKCLHSAASKRPDGVADREEIARLKRDWYD